MDINKRNILYTIIAVIIIVAIGFFVAIASMFWISLYLAILLIVIIIERKKKIILIGH